MRPRQLLILPSRYLFIALASCISLFLQAQTTISTASAGAMGYAGNNGVGANAAITFVIENTNSFRVQLTGLETYKNSSYPGTPANFTLWYSAVSLSGQPNIATPDWAQVASVTSSNLATGYNTIFSGLNFILPAGAQYRFALQCDAGIAYSGANGLSASPSIFSAGGVNLKLGDATISGGTVGYGGGFPSPGNTPRWFTGSITFAPASTLPVRLGSLSASKTDQDVLVSWTSSSDINFSHYDVERSADGLQFSAVGRVDAAGNNGAAAAYRFEDIGAAITSSGDRVYYRLRMVDMDGRYSYSAIMSVSLTKQDAAGVKVYPSPFANELSVQVKTKTAGEALLLLSDASGKTHVQKNYRLLKGTNILTLSGLGNLSSGTYFLTVVSDTGRTTTTVVK